MPIEPSDNTRVVVPYIIPTTQEQEQAKRMQLLAQNVDQLWDADQVKKNENMQNAINANFWHSAYQRQINYDPHTQQRAIQVEYDTAKNNARALAENLAMMGVGEGVGQAVKWVQTPIKYTPGVDTELVEVPNKLSQTVIKHSTRPVADTHVTSLKPEYFVKTTYQGRTPTGANIYHQSKVTPTNNFEDLAQRAAKNGDVLENGPMGPTLISKGRVYTDLEIGKKFPWSRPKIFDWISFPLPEYRALAAAYKNGGIIKSN